jgi:hypothetical protein
LPIRFQQLEEFILGRQALARRNRNTRMPRDLRHRAFLPRRHRHRWQTLSRLKYVKQALLDKIGKIQCRQVTYPESRYRKRTQRDQAVARERAADRQAFRLEPMRTLRLSKNAIIAPRS